MKGYVLIVQASLWSVLQDEIRSQRLQSQVENWEVKFKWVCVLPLHSQRSCGVHGLTGCKQEMRRGVVYYAGPNKQNCGRTDSEKQDQPAWKNKTRKHIWRRRPLS